MKVAKTVAGVCAVRDANDLIGLVCGHYLRMGFGHIAFIDDGSTDGTFEFLSMLSRKDSRISVKRMINSEYNQNELVSNMANELIARSFSITVPFDADEFWNVSGPDLERRYAGVPALTFRGQWVNYVQNRASAYPRPFGLLGVKYRMPLSDGDQNTVRANRRPFVSCVVTKVGCKSTQELEFDVGQHRLIRGGGEIDSEKLEIFHFPLRYKSEITKRGLNYEPRRAPVRKNDEDSWQSLYHHEVVVAERVDEVWAANSADRHGFLDCYGEPVRLIPDRRLQRLLVRSGVYLFRRHGIFLMA